MTEETKTEAHSDRTHAALGGSTAERWCNCPGSYWKYMDLPAEETTSEAALKGTRLHEVCEAHLENFLLKQEDGKDRPLPEGLNATEEEIEAAKFYVAQVWEHGLNFSITGKKWGIEDRFDIDPSLGMYGFVDFWSVCVDDRAKLAGLIEDYKSGYHLVAAEGNYQLAFYAVGLWLWVKSKGKELDYIRVGIVQPNDFKNPYKEVKISAKKLAAWHKLFVKAAKEIFVKKSKKLKAGSWCEWCRAKGTCTKYFDSVKAIVPTELKELDVKKDVRPPKIESLTDEQVATMYLNWEMVEAFGKELKEHILARHKAGTPLAGVKVIEKPGKRGWIDDEDKVAKGLKERGIEPYRQSLITMGNAEKAAKKLGKTIDEFIAPGKPSLAIVEASDPRPAAGSALDLLD